MPIVYLVVTTARPLAGDGVGAPMGPYLEAPPAGVPGALLTNGALHRLGSSLRSARRGASCVLAGCCYSGSLGVTCAGRSPPVVLLGGLTTIVLP